MTLRDTNQLCAIDALNLNMCRLLGDLKKPQNPRFCSYFFSITSVVFVLLCRGADWNIHLAVAIPVLSPSPGCAVVGEASL